jgi:hypothetical protein
MGLVDVETLDMEGEVPAEAEEVGTKTDEAVVECLKANGDEAKHHPTENETETGIETSATASGTENQADHGEAVEVEVEDADVEGGRPISVTRLSSTNPHPIPPPANLAQSLPLPPRITAKVITVSDAPSSLQLV